MLHTIQADFYRLFRSKGFGLQKPFSFSTSCLESSLSYWPRRRQYGIQIAPSDRSLDRL